MKIIQVTGSDLGGGAETVVRMHHMELLRLGHERQLVVGRKQTDDSSTVELPFRRGPKGMLRVTRWLQRKSGLQNLYSPTFRALSEQFTFKPDVLHFHSLHGIDSFAELSVVRRLSHLYPTVITLHDLWLMTGHCGHPLDCPRWKTGCGKCPDLTLYPAIDRDATRWNFLRKKKDFRDSKLSLFVPSNWLRDQVLQSPILSHLPVHVIANPVDIHTFAPGDSRSDRQRFGIRESERTVMLVAQHLQNPFKGIQDGIAAINSLKLPDIKVIIVGGSADQVAEKLTAPTVVLPFTNDPSQLAAYYRMADLLIVPSRGETFGLVAAEAMACGTPVVAFNVGGLKDVIGDDEGGILVPARNTTLMARAIENLLQDESLRVEKSRRGRLRVEQQFTLEQHSRNCLAVYQDII